jgi:hypothetical protein
MGPATMPPAVPGLDDACCEARLGPHLFSRAVETCKIETRLEDMDGKWKSKFLDVGRKPLHLAPLADANLGFPAGDF